MIHTPEERLIGFASNIPGIDVELYARRWEIETGYSNIGGMRARTRSKNPAVRLLCFVYSVLMYNSWQIAKVLAATVRKRFTHHADSITLEHLWPIHDGWDPPPDMVVP